MLVLLRFEIKRRNEVSVFEGSITLNLNYRYDFGQSQKISIKTAAQHNNYSTNP